MLVVFVGYQHHLCNVDGFYARNEGVNIGVGSFTTINLIGNRSGGDIVFGTDAGSGVLDIDIRSRWVEMDLVFIQHQMLVSTL